MQNLLGAFKNKSLSSALVRRYSQSLYPGLCSWRSIQNKVNVYDMKKRPRNVGYRLLTLEVFYFLISR